MSCNVEHIDEEELERYILKHACDEARIEEHLLVCHHCMDVLERLEDEIAVMKMALESSKTGKSARAGR
ncbi:MAG: hypothetical protein JO061_13280 [Acidobacteriaceae bacterium]|nr:hypothetical protein [Acidobacteriaceae bacterium]